LIDSEIKVLINRNYERAEKILNDNIDVLHSMKDALMKYETIDALQIDDLMARTEVRPPRDWDDRKPNDDKTSGISTKSDDKSAPDLDNTGDVPN
jgi:cell division protease FtsH